MTTAVEPLDIVAGKIKAHIAKGNQASEKADQHYMSASKLLVEARERSKTTADFEILIREQIGLCLSRAYELIAVAEGRKTMNEVRGGNQERVKRHRERTAADGKRGPLRNGKPNQDPLEQAKTAVLALSPTQQGDFIEWFWRWQRNNVRAAS